MKSVVIFGGRGFVGCYVAKHLLDECDFDQIHLIDTSNPDDLSDYRKKMINNDKIIHHIHDVREKINIQLSGDICEIYNFAAVHREPGHIDFEYYETNLLGAENVCKWAEDVNCKKLIFTSSISPYGVSELSKDENSIPIPVTAYGSSKLAAEKIHCIWQAKSSENQLLIVRPGVIFGASEGGNVSRLIKAVKNHYFVYTGNRKTIKAGVYVKELCHALMWVLNSQKAKIQGVTIFNMTMNPGPSIGEYVETIAKVAKIKILIPSIPITILFIAANIIDFIAKPLKINHPFSPVRIRKLIRSNHILPTYLNNEGYIFKYSLEDALSDWKNDLPEEWS
jgi:GlcNAc-P-P-Und epimerase